MSSNSVYQFTDSGNSNCKNCLKPVRYNQPTCTECGFPLNATEAEENQFYYRIGAKKLKLQELDKKISNAKTTLYIIACLTFLAGIIIYFMTKYSYDGALMILISNMVVAVIFILLGELAKEKPFAALLIALLLYVGLFFYGVLFENMSPGSGLIIRIIIVVYLVKGIDSASDAEKLRKELNK